MSSLDETPTFNLKAVVQETGLKPDTLRAWERRYSLPQPARSAGGHRLYSQRDIDILKWLIARQDEGLSISRAVDLFNQLLEEGKDPFWEMAPEEEAVGLVPLEVGDTLSGLRESWIDACLDFDEQQANYVLAQAFALYPPETVCIEVLQRGLSTIGTLWYEGQATVQQEHFASALATRRLETLLAASAPPTRSGRILIGCPPQEEHTFSPLLLTLLLRRRGWHTIYLGANVPLERMESTIADTGPDLLILTAQTLLAAANLAPVAALAQDEGVTVAFGGQIFNRIPELASRIAGHHLNGKLRLAPDRVEQLLASPGLAPAPGEPPARYREALAHFEARQAHIDAYILEHRLESAGPPGVPIPHLPRANRGMAEGIVAALTLGDLSFLEHDLAWVEGLVRNHEYPVADDLLERYLTLYHQAVSVELNEPAGQLIIDWLEELLKKDLIRANGQ
ncbi:MAG TPA: MerR family transcriptional regulator [Candidatus Sulfomarinibacteraceae bacterium]|nr:MerR family transcriptional regulator [Candidatus Sulfomarinibacteraceae bacterium]